MALCASVLAASGCIRSIDLQLPPEDGVETTVVGVGLDGASPSAFVFPKGTPVQIAAELQGEPQLTLMYFGEPPEALQLSPGQLSLQPDGRAWPTPRAQFLGSPPQTEFIASERTPPPLLAPFDWPRCVEAGGCAIEGQPDVCNLDCAPSEALEEARLPDIQCPEGWVDNPATLTRCAPPWPARTRCEQGHQPLEAAGCVPISVCPTGRWSEPPSGRAFHVQAGAQGPQDGSQSAPFATVAQAVAVAGDGDWVMLADGSYDLEGPVDINLNLMGACEAQTRLALGDAPLEVQGATLALHRMELTGAGSPLVVLVSGALHVEEARVGGPFRLVRQEGGALRVRKSHFGPRALGAINATRGRLSVEDSTLESGIGVLVSERAQLRNLVLSAGVNPAEPKVSALVFRGAGEVEVDNVWIYDSHGPGVEIRNTERVRISQLRSSDTADTGIIINGAPQVELDSLLIERPGNKGIWVNGPADVQIQGLFVLDARLEGLDVGALEPTRCSLNDAIMIGSQATGEMRVGRADAFQGSLVADNVILDGRTIARPNDINGAGEVRLYRGAAQLSRFEVFGAPIRGMFVRDLALDVSDFTVRSTGGSGALLESAEQTRTFTRVHFDGTQSAGVELTGAGIGPVFLRHVRGNDTASVVLLRERANAVLEQFEVRDSGAAFEVLDSSQLDVRSGRISGSAVGGRYPRGYDLNRLLVDVHFEDNERNLDEIEP